MFVLDIIAFMLVIGLSASVLWLFLEFVCLIVRMFAFSILHSDSSSLE